jgi:hypothetical protein
LIVVVGAVAFGVYVGHTDPGGVIAATYPSAAPSVFASAEPIDPPETASSPPPPPAAVSTSAVDVDAGALDDDDDAGDDDLDDASDDAGDAHTTAAAHPRAVAPTPRRRPKPHARPYRGHPWNR